MKVNNDMNKNFSIDDLVNDLTPVKPMNVNKGLALPMLMVAAFTALFISQLGLRTDLAAGAPQPLIVMRGGILLLLGLATAHAVVSMATPSVGKGNQGWIYAVGAALLFPISALIVAISNMSADMPVAVNTGWYCFKMCLAAASATSIPMVLWLRKGAPTDLGRAGWLTGLAAGGLGAFAYSFHCPFTSVMDISVWYTASITTAALIGRIVVPHLIRW